MVMRHHVMHLKKKGRTNGLVSSEEFYTTNPEASNYNPTKPEKDEYLSRQAQMRSHVRKDVTALEMAVQRRDEHFINHQLVIQRVIIILLLSTCSNSSFSNAFDTF